MTTTDFIPFGKPNFGTAEQKAIRTVLNSGWIGMGPETAQFELELSAFTGARHAVTVNSCTSALFLALLVNGIGPGDEVICPSFTWCSTANAAIYLGATPVFCDIDPGTFCVTPETIAACLTPRTRAVMVVHMGGLAADVEAIRRALPSHVRIIEDAAHALGATYPDGRQVGASGNLCCFSFYANKNLSTGEGGAILLNDAKLAARLVRLRLHGLSADAWKRYSSPAANVHVAIKEIGYKMNFTDLQAAIGRVQLSRQLEFTTRRLRIAKIYTRWLENCTVDLHCQDSLMTKGHARHLFQVMLPKRPRWLGRNQVLSQLRAAGIGASIHYKPLHKIQLYKQYCGGVLPVTNDVGGRVMSLPIGVAMTLRDAKRVTSTLDTLFAGGELTA